MKRTQHGSYFVDTHFLWGRVIIVLFLILGLVIAVLAFKSARDIRDHAAVPIVNPSPFIETVVISSPKTNLAVPSVRLVTRKDSYRINETIPVDLYIHTGGLETDELHVVMSYDPSLLDIDLATLAVLDLYKSVTIDSNKKGEFVMTLFTTSGLEYVPVATNTDVKIATVMFKPRTFVDAATKIQLKFSPDNTTQTSLFQFSQGSRSTLNSLKSVEGISFVLTP